MSREFTIENAYLKVTVSALGAQLRSVVRKCDGVEHLWQVDKDVWAFQAPILFPYTGRVVDDAIEAKGNLYEAPLHGFARHMEHELIDRTGDTLVLELCSCPKTLEKFPYEFRLLSTFTLENDTLHHTLTVENLDTEQLPFGIGYHTGFSIPFDDKHTAADYELRFSETESPLCVNSLPHGLLHGDFYYLGANICSVPLDENLFSNGSHCMVNLKSATLGLYENSTGRGVVCNIQEFPYTVIWSKPGTPRFVCIEPWHSLPSREDSSIKWEEKPAAAILNPGEAWSCTMSTSFVR